MMYGSLLIALISQKIRYIIEDKVRVRKIYKTPHVPIIILFLYKYIIIYILYLFIMYLHNLILCVSTIGYMV